MKYNLQLNEKQIQILIWGMELAIDRCCTDKEEKPFKELMEFLKDYIRR